MNNKSIENSLLKLMKDGTLEKGFRESLGKVAGKVAQAPGAALGAVGRGAKNLGTGLAGEAKAAAQAGQDVVGGVRGGHEFPQWAGVTEEGHTPPTKSERVGEHIGASAKRVGEGLTGKPVDAPSRMGRMGQEVGRGVRQAGQAAGEAGQAASAGYKQGIRRGVVGSRAVSGLERPAAETRRAEQRASTERSPLAAEVGRAAGRATQPIARKLGFGQSERERKEATAKQAATKEQQAATKEKRERSYEYSIEQSLLKLMKEGEVAPNPKDVAQYSKLPPEQQDRQLQDWAVNVRAGSGGRGDPRYQAQGTPQGSRQGVQEASARMAAGGRDITTDDPTRGKGGVLREVGQGGTASGGPRTGYAPVPGASTKVKPQDVGSTIYRNSIENSLLKLMKDRTIETSPLKLTKVMERPEDEDMSIPEERKNPASIKQEWGRKQAAARMNELGETGGTDRLGPIGRDAPPGFEDEAAKQKKQELAGKQMPKVPTPTGHQLNSIENSLLKIMKYGSEKPSEVGMTRKSALIEKQPQQPPSALDIETQGAGNQPGQEQWSALGALDAAANLVPEAIAAAGKTAFGAAKLGAKGAQKVGQAGVGAAKLGARGAIGTANLPVRGVKGAIAGGQKLGRMARGGGGTPPAGTTPPGPTVNLTKPASQEQFNTMFKKPIGTAETKQQRPIG